MIQIEMLKLLILLVDIIEINKQVYNFVINVTISLQMYSTKQYKYIKEQTTIFILVGNRKRKMNLLDSN